MNEYVFHIRNASPDDMAALLAVLEQQPGLTSIADIVRAADEIGFTISDRTRLEALATARDLYLVAENENALTEEGCALSQLEFTRPELFPDVVHGIQYGIWNSTTPGDSCFSWSYRSLCAILWQSGSIDISNRRELASTLEVTAREQFDRSDISFSSKSVGGAFLWLSNLNPPVFRNEGNSVLFSRRSFCPPELFLMAIDHFYEQRAVAHGTNLLLNNFERDTISQMCLLEPSSFDRLLEYAVAQFDILDKGVGGGWGQYLVLRRSVALKDFL